MLLANLALAAAIVIEVASTICLRYSEGFKRRRWIAPVVLGYTVSYTLLYISLENGMPLGIAYGVWAACGVILTAVLAKKLFKDPLTMRMFLAMCIMIAGVVLVELGH